MTWFSVMGEQGVQWLGEAGNAVEAVRRLMDDVGAAYCFEPVVYVIEGEPPAGWGEAAPSGWLSAWIEEHGQWVRGVESQVKVDGIAYDWSVVVARMDEAIVAEMEEAGVRAVPLSAGDTGVTPLNEYLQIYGELHADKHGVAFKVG